MDISQESIKLLISLLPGFLFIKIIALRCSINKQEVHEYIVDALIKSLVVYALANLFGISISGADWRSILKILGLTIILGLLWSIVINRDWIAKIMHLGNSRLSTHSSIFPIKGIKEFKGKYRLIRFSDGKEIVGILREYKHETHEALIEKGQMILSGGKLTPESAWYYSPSGEQIIYMRTIEKNSNEQKR